MRLIDADALMKRFEEMQTACKSVAEVLFFDGVMAMVENAPTIDAEPVVRCKDCKHWGTGYGGETDYAKVCEFAGWMVGANGYCVYGEKMDLEVHVHSVHM